VFSGHSSKLEADIPNYGSIQY